MDGQTEEPKEEHAVVSLMSASFSNFSQLDRKRIAEASWSMKLYCLLSALIAWARFDSGYRFSVHGFKFSGRSTRNPRQCNNSSCSYSSNRLGGREVMAPPSRGGGVAKTTQMRWMNGGAGKVEGDPSSTLSYYLLWSPNMLVKTVTTFTALMSLRFFFGGQLVAVLESTTTSTTQGSTGVPAMAQNVLNVVILPLLSSACCGVQLLINAMVGAGGCAGFNKYLGPLRPYFVGTLLATVVPRIVSGDITSWMRLSIQLLLAFLPEIVYAWNGSPVHRLVALKKQKAIPAEGMMMAQAEFDIPGMGCVACIKKINSSLRKMSTVTDSEAWLVDCGGRARVQYVAGSDNDAQEIALQLAEVVHGAGFDPCNVGKVDMKAGS